VVVLDASRGVEPQTESVWHTATRHGVPRVVFVNKLDAPGASVSRCVEDLRSRLGACPVVLQHLREDGTLVDLVEQRALHFGADGSVTRTPADEAERREQLIEQLAELDAALLERWARDEALDAAALHAALRRLTCAGVVVPVLCGAALKNKGVPPVLDAVVRYLPSPVDRALARGLVATEAGPVCGFVFKTDVDVHVGSLAWGRVFQGTLRPSDTVLVRPASKRERVSRVLGLHGGHFEPMQSVGPGGIAALVGLKSAKTGDTVTAPGLEVVLETLTTTEPVVELALTATSTEGQATLGEALKRACLEDPSLRVRVDAETGQTVLCGVGELHLAIWLEKLARRDGVSVKASAPVVSYRDTVGGEATVTYRHVRQNSGPGQFAVVTVKVAPAPSGAGVSVVDAVRGGALPEEFVAAVARGARAALERGVREGVAVTDVEVTVLDGVVHEVDSSAMAFEVAGSLAVQQAVERAGLRRLEPMAHAQVVCPQSHLGAALGEVAARRGAVRGMETHGPTVVVEARLPLARTFGFVTSLRSRTEGRGSVVLSPAGYDAV
jgi:elongation factor G